MKHNWEYKKLGEVCETQNGLWTGKKPPFVSIPVISLKNFTKDCKLKKSDFSIIDVEVRQLEKRKLQYGDILIEKSGGSDTQPVGRPIFFDIKEGTYSFSNFTAALRTDTSLLSPEFLYFVLYAYYFQGKTLYLQSKTTGIHNLDFKGFMDLSIPVPPLPTQQRIVAELDCISGILEKKRQQLKELDNLAQAIFYDMFGDPVENDKGWEVKKLGEKFHVYSGGTPSTGIKEYWDNGTISWIGSNMCQNQIIYENDGKYITELGLNNSSAKLFAPGSVLVALVGATIGKVALLKFPTATNQNIAGIDVPENNEFDSIFVFFLIQSLYDLFCSIGEGKFKMANLSFVRSLPIILPPLSLQQQFAKKIEAIERQKALINQSIKEVQTLFDCRMEDYFN